LEIRLQQCLSFLSFIRKCAPIDHWFVHSSKRVFAAMVLSSVCSVNVLKTPRSPAKK